MVGKIRGYGCNELDDHKVVKIILEAYSPKNEIVVVAEPPEITHLQRRLCTTRH